MSKARNGMPETVSVIIRDPRGLYLGVSRRNDHTVFGTPGGKTNPGESAHHAAARELFEETTLFVKSLNLIDVRQWNFANKWYTSEDVVSCYIGQGVFPTLPTDKDLLNISEQKVSEGEGIVKWVTFETLCAGPFGEYNTIVIPQTLAVLDLG